MWYKEDDKVRGILNKFIKLFKGKTVNSNNAITWREAMPKINGAFQLKSDSKKVMGLIKNGKYNEIKSIVKPSGGIGGIVGLMPETTKSIMEESCMDLGLNETNRIELASIIAYGSIYSDRGESIVAEFLKKVEENNIELNFPKDLINYMENNPRKKKYNLKDIAETYIRYYTTKAKSKSQLQQFSELGIKKVKIKTCRDQRVCIKCKKQEDVNHLVSKAPLLPLCWGCRCFYRPIIK